MNQEPYSMWRLPIDISTHGAAVDRLIIVVHIFMAVLFVGWGIYFIYCLIRFRERPGHTPDHTVRHFLVADFTLEVVIFMLWKSCSLFSSRRPSG